MDNIQLILGNCLDEMCYINDKSVNLVICDLPYGTTASNWDKEIPMVYLWEHYDRILKNNGTVKSIYVNVGSNPTVVSKVENKIGHT